MIAGDCPLVAGCVVAQASNAALHRLVIALDATEDAVAERTAFLRELAVLRQAAHESGLTVSDLALRAIPDDVAAHGVLSVADLRKRCVGQLCSSPCGGAVLATRPDGHPFRGAAERRGPGGGGGTSSFSEVRASVSRAAYVPPEGGMWANLISSVLSTVSVKPSGYVEGDDVEGTLAMCCRGHAHRVSAGMSADVPTVGPATWVCAHCSQRSWRGPTTCWHTTTWRARRGSSTS